MNQISDYIEENHERFLVELASFLRIPSISADPAFADDIERAADFLVDALNTVSVDKVEKLYCGGNPIIYAEKTINKNAPTVLIYGHYDVQPTGELEFWISPPFEPEIRNGNIFARGACDDKAQVYLIVKALEVLHKLNEMTCNVKIIFEGEEEIGSKSLDEFISKYKKNLFADVFVVCDTSMPESNKPTLITALRGIVYCELKLKTGDQDEHSGMYMGDKENAIQVLCDLIGKLKNDKKVVQIPGFYNYLHEMGDEERLAIQSKSGPKEIRITQENDELNTVELIPSLQVNGIWGGYTGEGPMTIIPSRAFAKMSIRLVEGQNCENIGHQLETYLRNHISPPNELIVNVLAKCNAVKVNQNTEAFQIAEKSLEKVFKTAVLKKQIGGTIPVVAMVKEKLNLEPILMGFGIESNNIHAPNEHFSLDHFFKGIETMTVFMHELGQLSQKSNSITLETVYHEA